MLAEEGMRGNVGTGKQPVLRGGAMAPQWSREGSNGSPLLGPVELLSNVKSKAPRRAPKSPWDWFRTGQSGLQNHSRSGPGEAPKRPWTVHDAGSGPAVVWRGIQRDPGDWTRNGPEMGQWELQ